MAIKTREQLEEKMLQLLTDKQEIVNEAKKEERKWANVLWAQFLNKDKEDIKLLYIPKTYISVWVSLAKFINLCVGREIYTLLPRGTEDRMVAKVKTAALNYEISQILDYEAVQVKQLLQYCVEGWTAMKVGWDDTNKRLLYPFIKNADIYFDPSALVMSDVEWVHQRVIKSRAQLEKLEELGIYQNVKAFIERATEYRKENFSALDEPNPFKNKYEIFECWTKDERITVGASSQRNEVGGNESIEFDTLLTPFKKWDSPFKDGHGDLPYVISCFDPQIESLQGVGIPEIMRPLQQELDATRRLHLKASELGILGLWAYKTGTLDEIGKDALRDIRPGVFPLEDFNNPPKRIDSPASQGMFVEEKLLNEDIEDASASYRPLRGAPMARAETLGGTKILQSSANERHQVRVLMFSIALKKIGMLMLKTLLQYQDKEVEVQVFDGDKELWEKMKFNKKEELKKEYNLILNVGHTEDIQAARQASLLKAIEVISAMPDFARRVDKELLGKMLFSAIDPKLEHNLILSAKDEFIESLKQIPSEELRLIVATGLQALQSQKQASPSQAGGQGEVPPTPEGAPLI